MPLHRNTNKPDRQLLLDDIEGSKPRNKWLLRTLRRVNPLEPEYTLPSFVTAPPVSTKFTRDSYDVSDIEGTKCRPLYPLAQRQNHLVDDIEGAQSGWKPRHARARHEAAPLAHSLNVSDITGGGFRSQRTTNPLTPSYRVNGMDIADDPVKSRPRGLPKAREGPFYPLTTQDIEGAQPGWRPLPQVNPPLEARRHYRNTNYMGDIPGAQADTVKHSICTERHVNPLNPVYASLDGEPLTNPQTPLYKEPACVEAEAQLDRIIAAEETAATEAAAASATKPQLYQAKEPSKIGNQAEAGQSRQQLEAWKQQRPSSEPLSSARGGNKTSQGRRDTPFSARHGITTPHTRAASSGGRRRSPNETDKDSLIRLLQDEVRLLRKNTGREAWQRRPPTGCAATAPFGNKSGGSSGRLSARSWPESPADRRQQSINTVRQAAGTPAPDTPHPLSASSSANGRSRGGKLPRSAGGAAPHRPSGRSRSVDGGAGGSSGHSWKSGEGRGVSRGGGAMLLRSRGEQGEQGAERLVLRSASGTPRVPLTPSEARLAREYTDEVSSVRGLV